MRVGVAGGKDDWPVAARLGYDYFEANLSAVAALSEAEFSEWKRFPAATGIAAEAFNGFFGGDVRLYEASDGRLKNYCARALDRAAALGGKIAVVGSGRARSVPEGMAADEAEARFAAILRIVGDCAAAVGMKAVIEPLNRLECNFINTVEEAAALCRKAGHPAVGVLVDFYHFYVNGEAVGALDSAAGRLWHAHLARPATDRGAPKAGDVAALAPYADALRRIGYTGRLSLECAWQTSLPADAGEALAVMKKIFG